MPSRHRPLISLSSVASVGDRRGCRDLDEAIEDDAKRGVVAISYGSLGYSSLHVAYCTAGAHASPTNVCGLIIDHAACVVFATL